MSTRPSRQRVDTQAVNLSLPAAVEAKRWPGREKEDARQKTCLMDDDESTQLKRDFSLSSSQLRGPPFLLLRPAACSRHPPTSRHGWGGGRGKRDASLETDRYKHTHFPVSCLSLLPPPRNQRGGGLPVPGSKLSKIFSSNISRGDFVAPMELKLGLIQHSSKRSGAGWCVCQRAWHRSLLCVWGKQDRVSPLSPRCSAQWQQR